jgi:hypothetical protein
VIPDFRAAYADDNPAGCCASRSINASVFAPVGEGMASRLREGVLTAFGIFVCENAFLYKNITTHLFASAFFQPGHSTQTSFAEKSDDLFFGHADGVKAQPRGTGGQ